jgi:LysR family transcriptional regulator for metE and metH
LHYEPVFDYEQVLVVHRDHRWAGQEEVQPEQLAEETLITYPVPLERLDIYQMFLLPAKVAPRRHKTIETTDIMLQMVASGRGVTALPKWLVTDYAPQLQLRTLRLGPAGIQKHIYLGARAADSDTDYLQAFIAMARQAERYAP